MVCGTFSIKKIADADVDGVEERFRLNDPPPNSVTREKQTDGTWTVTAVFPPCPENTTHTLGSG